MYQDKKIVFFIPSLYGGGAEKFFLNLIKVFTNEGLSVELVLAQKQGPYLKEVEDSVKIVDLGSRRVFFSIPSLSRYIKKEDPYVLISAMPHVNIVALLSKFFVKNKTKIIVVEQNNFSAEQSRIPFFKRIVTKFFAKFLYRKAAAVVAVSRGVAEDLIKTIKISTNQLHVIYNSIDVENILEKSKKSEGHVLLQKKNIPTVLGVGRFIPQKDFPTLIKAFEQIRRNREVRLIILGEGEDRVMLENLVQEFGLGDCTHMPGFVDNPYVYMKQASVFALSSIHEGLPLVLTEAMACGTPVVSTDCPSGPAEILENGKYGKLVPVGDAGALAEAIEETLNNPIDSEILRARAEEFNVEKISKEYLKVMGL